MIQVQIIREEKELDCQVSKGMSTYLTIHVLFVFSSILVSHHSFLHPTQPQIAEINAIRSRQYTFPFISLTAIWADSLLLNHMYANPKGCLFSLSVTIVTVWYQLTSIVSMNRKYVKLSILDISSSKTGPERHTRLNNFTSANFPKMWKSCLQCSLWCRLLKSCINRLMVLKICPLKPFDFALAIRFSKQNFIVQSFRFPFTFNCESYGIFILALPIIVPQEPMKLFYH